MDTITLKLKKLSDKAIIPTYGHVDKDGVNEGDVCLDMYAISVEWDEKMDCYIYHTGLAFETSYGKGMFCMPRSSNRKTDCYLANSVGVIDTVLYRGEVCFCYKDRTSFETRVKLARMEKMLNCMAKGIKDYQELMYHRSLAETKVLEQTRNLEFAPFKDLSKAIGQFVVFDFKNVNIEVVDELSETSRGDGGFGSTDKK